MTKPKPHFHLLDRFLVMMERKDIPVILCFNKQDLAKDEEMQELLKIYQTCGYPVIFASARKEENIDPIRKALKGKTTVIAGPSGVGKIFFDQFASVSGGCRWRPVPSAGRSIVESIPQDMRNLLPIDEDSFIMDTPGFSSLYVNDMEKEELKYCFREFAPYEGKCRF